MKTEEFNEHLKYMQQITVETLIQKAEEYATDGDRLHNFKVAGETQGIDPIQALGGMMCKHTVSVYDMIRDAKAVDGYPLSLWEEKIKDHINYLLLLWALVHEEEWAIRDHIPDAVFIANDQIVERIYRKEKRK